MNERVTRTCRRCGYSEQMVEDSLRRYMSRDPETAIFCSDCRGSEKTRKRATYVPTEAIAEIVRLMKEKQSA